MPYQKPTSQYIQDIKNAYDQLLRDETMDDLKNRNKSREFDDRGK